MAHSLLLVVFYLTIGVIFVYSKPYDPMVAFVCNKGAMHMDPELGWHRDSHTNCKESKDDILNYCKSVYPLLDITNIVETSEHMIIKGWCPLDETSCENPDTFKVRPYRCLTGVFQGDALIVPHDCVFDHIHHSEECKSYDYWGDVANAQCATQHKMIRDSFAILMPCDTDLFSGVEFVCCPEGGAARNAQPSTTPHTELSKPEISIKVSVSNKTVSVVDGTKGDVIDKYLHLQSSQGEYINEHDAYEVAKKQLTSSNHGKVFNLMKAWSEARDRVVKLKNIDPKQAEQLNVEITNRYQREYLALEQEDESKTLQLDAVHQQHVQTNLNLKKRHAMQQLMEGLQAKSYNMADILAKLQKYISIEQKDSQHCIKHFIKIRARDPVAAKDMLPSTIEHLTLISLRINQSIDLLDTLKDKDVVMRLKQNIRSWLARSFINLDTTIKHFETLEFPEHIGTQRASQSTANTELPVTQRKANMYKVYADKLSQTDFVKKSNQADDNHAASAQAKMPQAANMKLSEVNAEVQKIKKNGASGNMSAGASIAIAFSVIAAMMVVVFAVLIVKKKSHNPKQRLTNTYLEVSTDGDISPEDRHIAAMQNGYENPTYKLLEQRKV